MFYDDISTTVKALKDEIALLSENSKCYSNYLFFNKNNCNLHAFMNKKKLVNVSENSQF